MVDPGWPPPANSNSVAVPRTVGPRQASGMQQLRRQHRQQPALCGAMHMGRARPGPGLPVPGGRDTGSRDAVRAGRTARRQRRAAQPPFHRCEDEDEQSAGLLRHAATATLRPTPRAAGQAAAKPAKAKPRHVRARRAATRWRESDIGSARAAAQGGAGRCTGLPGARRRTDAGTSS